MPNGCWAELAIMLNDRYAEYFANWIYNMTFGLSGYVHAIIVLQYSTTFLNLLISLPGLELPIECNC